MSYPADTRRIQILGIISQSLDHLVHRYVHNFQISILPVPTASRPI